MYDKKFIMDSIKKPALHIIFSMIFVTMFAQMGIEYFFEVAVPEIVAVQFYFAMVFSTLSGIVIEDVSKEYKWSSFRASIAFALFTSPMTLFISYYLSNILGIDFFSLFMATFIVSGVIDYFTLKRKLSNDVR